MVIYFTAVFNVLFIGCSKIIYSFIAIFSGISRYFTSRYLNNTMVKSFLYIGLGMIFSILSNQQKNDYKK